MKKLILLSILTLFFLVLAGCNKRFKPDTLPTYISSNYNKQQHHLDLRSQSLIKMPNICADIKDKKTLDDIWSIDLGNNKIKSIDADYSCLFNLKELNLSYNQISSIKNLDGLSFLSILQLQKNNIKDISGLEKIKTLQILNLAYNQIIKTTGLEKLINLQELELQHNQITDISGLFNLINLTSLKLEFNQINGENSFDIIDRMKKLKWISLGENQLPEDKVVELQNKINPVQ